VCAEQVRGAVGGAASGWAARTWLGACLGKRGIWRHQHWCEGGGGLWIIVGWEASPVVMRFR
jgi:hypothetical protein